MFFDFWGWSLCKDLLSTVTQVARLDRFVQLRTRKTVPMTGCICILTQGQESGTRSSWRLECMRCMGFNTSFTLLFQSITTNYINCIKDIYEMKGYRKYRSDALLYPWLGVVFLELKIVSFQKMCPSYSFEQLPWCLWLFARQLLWLSPNSPQGCLLRPSSCPHESFSDPPRLLSMAIIWSRYKNIVREVPSQNDGINNCN